MSRGACGLRCAPGAWRHAASGEQADSALGRAGGVGRGENVGPGATALGAEHRLPASGVASVLNGLQQPSFDVVGAPSARGAPRGADARGGAGVEGLRGGREVERAPHRPVRGGRPAVAAPGGFPIGRVRQHLRAPASLPAAVTMRGLKAEPSFHGDTAARRGPIVGMHVDVCRDARVRLGFARAGGRRTPHGDGSLPRAHRSACHKY